jgi:hypothetical protein
LTLAGSFAFAIFVAPGCQTVTKAEANHQTSVRLKEIGRAVLAYCAEHKRLPPSAIYNQDGKPLLSWRVALLPYLGQGDLYRQFKLDESWDNPHNLELAGQMPDVFAPPAFFAGLADPHTTYFQVYVGPGTAFEGRIGISILDFPDGTSDTVLVVPGPNAVLWTQPTDLEFSPPKPGVRPAGIPTDSSYAFVLFADGHTEHIPLSWTDDEIRTIITRNGREPIPKGWR